MEPHPWARTQDWFSINVSRRSDRLSLGHLTIHHYQPSKARFWPRNWLEAEKSPSIHAGKGIDHAFVAVAPWWCKSNALSDARLRERPREEAPYVSHI